MKSRPKPTYSQADDWAKLTALSQIVGGRLEELFEQLCIRLHRRGKMFAGTCPVHGGDNPTAFNIFPDGHSVVGNWRCHTHHCEQHFRKTVIGFTQGVLSHQRFGWTSDKSSRELSFQDTLAYLCDFVGQDYASLRVDTADIEKRKFISQISMLNVPVPRPSEGWEPAAVFSRIARPGKYFVGRGFSSQVLRKCDVGDSIATDPTSPMFERAVVPVFDMHHKRIVGVSGRSIFDRCSSCGLFHKQESACPSTEAEKFRAVKWHHHGLRRESHLYGFCLAKRAILETETVILVEGPPDVWRLMEAGYPNAVAMFGTFLSDEQQCLLEASGAMNVVSILDNDEAGHNGQKDLASKLSRSFRLKQMVPSGHDVGEMTAEQVKELVG